MDDRRDECVSFLRSLVPLAFKQRGVCVPSGHQYAESASTIHSVAMQLAARPETLPSYKLRLYPLSIERSALLTQLEVEERNSLESAEAAYELERECVEEEWKRSRDRIRERLLRRWWIPRSHSRYCISHCENAIWSHAHGSCHRRRVRHLDSSSGRIDKVSDERVGAVFTLYSRREDDSEYIVRRGDST